MSETAFPQVLSCRFVSKESSYLTSEQREEVWDYWLKWCHECCLKYAKEWQPAILEVTIEDSTSEETIQVELSK